MKHDNKEEEKNGAQFQTWVAFLARVTIMLLSYFRQFEKYNPFLCVNPSSLESRNGAVAKLNTCIFTKNYDLHFFVHFFVK